MCCHSDSSSHIRGCGRFSQHTLGRGEKTKLTQLNTPPSFFLTQLSHTVSTISLRTGTSCRWAWPWTPWGCGGSGGWRSPGCELSGPRCGSGRGPGWLCWGWWRSAYCAHRCAGPSARGPCMQRTPAWLQDKHDFVCALKVVNSLFFLSVELRFCPCCSYVKLKISGPGQLCLVLLNLIWKSQAGMVGAWDCSEESQADVTSRWDIAVAQSWSVCEGLRRGSWAGLTPPENMREDGDGGRRMKEKRYWMSRRKGSPNWEEHSRACVVAEG